MVSNIIFNPLTSASPLRVLRISNTNQIPNPLQKLRSPFFTDSMSNFLFAGHESVPAGELFRALKENDIYVRYWNKDRISNRLRITIGTDEQMDRFLEFLRSYLNN